MRLSLSFSSFSLHQLSCLSAFRLVQKTHTKRSNVLMVIIASFTSKQVMILIERHYVVRSDNASIYPTFPIYISNVSHLYIQCLPSIYPTPSIYISNTYGLYLQHRETGELSVTKVSNGIAFIKHDESRAYSID